MKNLPVTVLIPSYNMGTSLVVLIKSIISSGLINIIEELIIVDDGSTDDTKHIVKQFSSHLNIRYHDLGENVGRFRARVEGAKTAKTTSLLFLDARTECGKDIYLGIQEFWNYSVVQGTVRIPVDEGLFNLYWERSHRFIFQANFKDQKEGFWLTSENFDHYICGTTIFYTKKEIFLYACEKFLEDPLNDDRALIQEIVKIEKIWVTEKLEVIWRPRQEIRSFLYRLWERGPSFVSYHVYGPGSPLKWFVYLGLITVVANLFTLMSAPVFWTKLACLQLFILAATIILFTRSPKEIIKLSGLHIMVILFFGMGILKGLLVEFSKRKVSS